tara:strand:+ start:1218 stop:1541 length:324 start_codon:yes stop_codon:yes gene_type:complete
MNSPYIGVLITDLIFIAVALGINKNNAKYLLSGYNTMSKKEKDKFDLENYLVIFKRFFLILAATSTVVFIILINLLNQKIAVMLYSSYIIIMLIWMVFKGNNFKKLD